jgi:N-methylhydantoinase B
MSFSLIAERRRHAPRGARGGRPGARGRDLLDGRPLPGKVTGALRAGQRLRIETPGGGGFGTPSGGAEGAARPPYGDSAPDIYGESSVDRS